MEYYVYIDESGQFKNTSEEGVKSIVGGFITTMSLEQIEIQLDDKIKNVNKKYNVNFNKNDLHIAPLLHPETANKPEEKKRFSAINQSAREYLAESCKELLINISDKIISSTNNAFDFGEEDNQQRYGTVLCAFVHETISFINSKNDVSSLKMYIAKRHPVCLPGRQSILENESMDNRNKTKRFIDEYHQRMVQYISRWTKKGLPKINVSVGFSPKYKIGYDLADVACYYLRGNKNTFSQNIVLKTEPNKSYAAEYTQTESDIINQLIEKKEFETAYRWASDVKQKEQIWLAVQTLNLKEKFGALSSLINVGHELIDRRTLEKNALTNAISLFNKIISLSKNSNDEQIIDCFISALNGLLICSNHCGDKEQQHKVLNAYQGLIKKISHIPYFTKLERILAVRNRAYNQHFNDYRFQEIIDDFENVVKERLKQLPENEIDGLTGEMLGTIGQAYAFLSKNNSEYAKRAEDYFIKSMKHFPEGHKYHQMSVNYLTILKWYRNDISYEKEAFSLHPEIRTKGSIKEWVTEIVNSNEYHLGTAFNLSVLIRLAVWQGPVANKILTNIEDFLRKCEVNQHPYEFIYKWLGVAYLQNSEYETANKAFDKSIELSHKLGFTVQTIALSTRGLKIISCKQNNDKMQEQLETAGLHTNLTELMDVSIGFMNYIQSIGGKEQLLKDIENNDIDAIAKWLPFAYA